MGVLGVNHPVLSYTLPAYLPQISPGTHLELIPFRNQLSVETVSATLTDTFKSHLNKEWLCQEFLYNWEAVECSTRV